jgi:hypothetical protein
MNRLLGSPIADVGGVRYEYPTTKSVGRIRSWTG